MRSRSIDNFLSQQEIELITKFIQHSMDRFEKYDGIIRMNLQRYNTDELQKLYIFKHTEWDKALKTQMPQSSSTYIEFLRESDDPYPCPIEQFFKAFMQVIEQAIPPKRFQNILNKLENELIQCIFPCPCPSDPK